MFDALQRISQLQENEAPVLNPPASLSKSTSRHHHSLKRQVSRRRSHSQHTGAQADTIEEEPLHKHAAVSAQNSARSGFELASEDWSESETASEPEEVSARYSILWWIGIVLALVLPELLAKLVNIGATLEDMSNLRQAVIDFPKTHPLKLPPPGKGPANFDELDHNLIAFHGDLLQLWHRIVKLKVLDPVSESSMEFAVSSEYNFEPRRDYTLSLYLLLSIAVYFSNNVHLSLVLLHLNLFDLAVCLRTKALDDSIQTILDPLSAAIEQYLLLPMSMEHQQQQSYLLNKMIAIRQHWEDQALGISFSVPLANTVLSINIGLLMSIVAATSVRCINVVVYGFYPSLGRIDIMSWFLGRMLPTKAPAELCQPSPCGAVSSGRTVSGLQNRAPSMPVSGVVQRTPNGKQGIGEQVGARQTNRSLSHGSDGRGHAAKSEDGLRWRGHRGEFGVDSGVKGSGGDTGMQESSGEYVQPH